MLQVLFFHFLIHLFVCSLFENDQELVPSFSSYFYKFSASSYFLFANDLLRIADCKEKEKKRGP